jgi:hypothetical protein
MIQIFTQNGEKIHGINLKQMDENIQMEKKQK